MGISVANLTKNYGAATVIHGISFDVAQGEFVSLLGPSGCSKTTTLRCIAGLEEANGGVIQIRSTVVSAPERGILKPPHERNIGMVFQSYAIWPHMNVAQNVGFPLSVRGVSRTAVGKEVDEALGVVGMLHLKDRQPSQLSGGQQQRVALARAIIGRPDILLFDEPLSNLDAKLREGTRAEILRLQRKLDVAAVYVTHDQEEALSMSDRVIVMEGGRIMQVGTPKALYRSPDNRFVADFVGHASFIDIAASGSGGWATADGTPIRVENPKGDPAIRYQMMLRPEAADLFAGDKQLPAEAAGQNRLYGSVQDARYMGAHIEYHIKTAGSVVKVHSRLEVAPGADVVVSFPPESARLVAVSA